MIKTGIESLDKNFKIEVNLGVTDYIIHDIRKNDCFDIYGLYDPKNTESFCRMPNDIAKSTSVGVEALNFNTAGGRIAFSTDSEYVIIKTKMPLPIAMPHITQLGQSGFDMYEKIGAKHYYRRSFMPPYTGKDGYEAIHHFGSVKKRDLIINFPLYNNVNEVYIGVCETASLEKCTRYTYEKPFLYYGSSITQGGCASRPGNAYQAMVSRKYDADFINLGFSGNARAEEAMCRYLATIDCSLFVMDYDHNAPDPEYLEKTHYAFYKLYRSLCPETPIILMSMPDFSPDDWHISRRDTVLKTYIEAKNNNDKNIYFIDGETIFMGDERDSCTVDGTHPNDLGFFKMATALYDKIDLALGLRR